MIALTAEGRLRARRHALLAIVCTGATAALVPVLHGDLRERISTATAYVALVLLAMTLSLAPLNLLRSQPNPVSFNRRRDFGIWSAIVGVSHAAIGLTVHLRGRMHLYFFSEPGHPSIAGLRADAFGAANDTGLVAALLLLVLALISNDIALRGLGTTRWRTVQRSAYVVLGLTIAHAALYQAIGTQRLWLVVVLVAASVAVLTLQALGVRRHREATQAGATRRAP